jgi:hypothetical protein
MPSDSVMKAIVLSVAQQSKRSHTQFQEFLTAEGMESLDFYSEVVLPKVSKSLDAGFYPFKDVSGARPVVGTTGANLDFDVSGVEVAIGSPSAGTTGQAVRATVSAAYATARLATITNLVANDNNGAFSGGTDNSNKLAMVSLAMTRIGDDFLANLTKVVHIPLGLAIRVVDATKNVVTWNSTTNVWTAAPDALEVYAGTGSLAETADAAATISSTNLIANCIVISPIALAANGRNVVSSAQVSDANIILAAKMVNAHATVPATIADIQSDDMVHVFNVLKRLKDNSITQLDALMTTDFSDDQKIRIEGIEAYIAGLGRTASTYTTWDTPVENGSSLDRYAYMGAYRFDRTDNDQTAGYTAVKFYDFLANKGHILSDANLKTMMTSNTKWETYNATTKAWVEVGAAIAAGLALVQAKNNFDSTKFAGPMTSAGLTAHVESSGNTVSGYTAGNMTALIALFTPAQNVEFQNVVYGALAAGTTPFADFVADRNISGAFASADAAAADLFVYATADYNATAPYYPATAPVAIQAKIAFLEKVDGLNTGASPIEDAGVLNAISSQFRYNSTAETLICTIEAAMSATDKISVPAYDAAGNSLTRNQKNAKAGDLVKILKSKFNLSARCAATILRTTLHDIDAAVILPDDFQAVARNMDDDVLIQYVYNNADAAGFKLTTLPLAIAGMKTRLALNTLTPAERSRTEGATRQLLRNFANFTAASNTPALSSYSASISSEDARDLMSEFIHDTVGATSNNTAALMRHICDLGGVAAMAKMNEVALETPTKVEDFNYGVGQLLSDTTNGFAALPRWNSGAVNSNLTMLTSVTANFTAQVKQRTQLVESLLNHPSADLAAIVAGGTNLNSTTYNDGVMTIIELFAGDNNQLQDSEVDILVAAGILLSVIKLSARSEYQVNGYTRDKDPSVTTHFHHSESQ